MFKKAPILLFLVCFSVYPSFSFSQNSDSLCCTCFKYDTLGVTKITKFRRTLQQIEPSYVQHLVSLSENVDLIQYEKYNYLLKLDKFLKFRISKEIASLENSKDSLSKITKLELEYLNTNLRDKIRVLSYKIRTCEENAQIQKYIKKRELISSVNPDYSINYVNLINSTIDENRMNYKALTALETNLLEKLHLKKTKLLQKESFKLTSVEKNELLLLDELINESKLRMAKFEENKDKVIESKFEFSKDEKVNVPIEYFLKELIVNSDTIQLGANKNEEKIIVANNTMYVFRNDSLVETIKNEDNEELASIFDNKKPISVDNYDGLFYTIQIGTYSKEVTVKELRVKSNLFYKNLPNGNIRYSYGMFNDLTEVESAKKTLEMIGITDIVVIAYHKKERISIKQAKKLKSHTAD